MADQSGVEIVERDYARKPLTPDEVSEILGSSDASAMLNTRHAIYKERGFASALPARDELIALIVAEPNLLRRPIVRKGKQVVVGFDQEAFAAVINS